MGFARFRSVFVLVVLLALGAAATAPWFDGRAEMPFPSLTKLVDGSPGWKNVTAPPTPDTVAGAMMAYSTAADRFLLFGGWDGEGVNQTWVFDPANRTWAQVMTSVAPSSRGDAQLAYDSQDGVFVLFGGWHEEANGSYTRLADTWAFSLVNDTWWSLHPALAPSPRSDGAIGYDPTANQVLLFGGFSGSAYLGDAWSFSYPNDTWTPRASGAMPSARADGRMAYDSNEGRFYLYGGNDYSDPSLNFHHLADTWEYTWDTNTWTLVETTGSPGPRDYAVLAFDPKADALLLFGGYGNRTILGDTWAFDIRNETWQEVPGTPAPPPRFAGVGGYDPQADTFLVFGGLGNGALRSDTWILVNYVPRAPTKAPQSFDLPLLIALLGFAAIVAVLGLRRPLRIERGGKSATERVDETTPGNSHPGRPR